jgi:hypothetical protein
LFQTSALAAPATVAMAAIVLMKTINIAALIPFPSVPENTSPKARSQNTLFFLFDGRAELRLLGLRKVMLGSRPTEGRQTGNLGHELPDITYLSTNKLMPL